MEKLDKHIKEQLVDYEMMPPAGFWHQISEQLNYEEHAVVAKQTSPFDWKQTLRIAAVVVVLFGLGGFLRHQQTNNQIAAKPTLAPSSVKEEVDAVQPKSQIATKTILPAHNAKQTPQQPNVLKTESPVLKQEDMLVPEVAEVDVKQTVKSNENEDISNTSIPVYSLKLLNSKVPENDEITVLEKKENKKVSDDSKKVIILQKSISKKPEIYFQVPLRF